jgi:hypothetical protein
MKSGFTTEGLAEATGHKPQTLRAAYCKNSHWCGLRPSKLPNGRLLWPADAIERLTTGQAAKPEAEAAPCSN